MTISVLSPAKLNLFLHITGQRADGYHELQTLFQFIDWGDELTFEPSASSTIELSPAIQGVPEASNLIVRAARLLQQATGCQQGAKIQLSKQLPMGGGLGGGSSNAASTLVALNQLWGTGLSKQQLQVLGLQLGADVPIFVYGQAALATGVGEQFEAVTIPEPWYLILHPHCHADTALLFQQKQLTRNSKLIRLRAFLSGQGHNDFEPVLRHMFPLMERCFRLLATETRPQLTGSGSCIFASFSSATQAEACQATLVAKLDEFGISSAEVDWKVAKGHNLSPLYFGSLGNTD